MRKPLVIAGGAILALVMGVGTVAAAGLGPPATGFYVDGSLYRTIGTQTDLSDTGAPANSFDTIYDLGGGGLKNVAEAAPGDTDYNGGRWMVLPVQWNVTPVQYTSAEQVLAAEAAGDIDIGDPVKYFVCPAIPAR
jgi:hypothetical protein